MTKKHALIIDDDVNNRGVLGELLMLEGISYTQVPDWKRLHKILASIPQIDIVFLDLEMPGTDGFAIFETLRSIPSFEAVPIVAYSVHINQVNRVREKGFNGFIGKPLDPDRFSEQLSRLLRNERVWSVS